MRKASVKCENASPLSLANPPERAILWIPGCSRADLSCDWGAFPKVVESVVIPEFVK
jgi:hypothetical protein